METYGVLYCGTKFRIDFFGVFSPILVACDRVCTLEKKSENNSILQLVGLHFYTWYILAGNNPAVGCLHFLIVLQYPPISKLYANYLMLPKKMGYGLWLWCLTSLTIVQLYSGAQFYCLRTPEYPEKTTLQVAKH